LKPLASITSLCVGLSGSDCVPAALLGGAAVGAAGTAAVVEHRKQEALEELDRAFERGEIDKAEYLKRKRELERTGVAR